MVGPISSDKLLPQTDNHSSVTGGKNAHQKSGNTTDQTAQQPPIENRNSEDQVSVSDSGRLISQGVDTSGSGRIQTREQASQLLSQIHQQIANAGSLALAAQATVQPGQLNALLESAPA